MVYQSIAHSGALNTIWLKIPELKFNILKESNLNYTQVKVGQPQNFFLAFIEEFEKQIIIKQTVEVGQ